MTRLQLIARWSVLLVAGAAASWLLQLVHVPAAMMLGPLVVAAVMGAQGHGVAVPRGAQRTAQALVATLIAVNLHSGMLQQVIQIWPLVMVFVLMTLLIAALVALMAARTTGLDPEVAVWGFMPGMAGTMVMLADERGVDGRMVAFIQYQRLLMVIVAMVGVGLLLAGPVTSAVAGAPPPTLMSTALVAAVCAGGLAIAERFPAIPAGATFIPLVGASVLSLNGVNIAVPHLLVALTFLLIGAQIGSRFTPQMLRLGLKALPRLLAASLLLLVLCGLSGVVLSVISGADLITACLATVPGSIDAIALIALNTGADMSFVMTLQTVRLFAVVLAGPFIARGLIRLQNLRY